MTQTTSNLTEALAAPFAQHEVKWKPQSVKGNRALALAYIDCRTIQDRLDDVLGVECWQDEYEILTDGSVMCKLQLKIGERWITKMDVGSPSEQPDGGDRMKAAFSDALKRAAVKFGVGRYLYRLPAQWADYDPVKKQFVKPPLIAPPTRPKPKTEAVAAPTPAPVAANLPQTGEELHQRLREYDAKLAANKVCGVGSLLSHVVDAGVKAGFSNDLSTWGGQAMKFAYKAVKEFESNLPTRPALTAA